MEVGKNYTELPGSHKVAPRADKLSGINKSQPASVTILLRPKETVPDLTSRSQYKTFNILLPGQFKSRHGARAADVDEVIRFAHLTGLTVYKINLAQRTIELRG